MSLSFFMIDVCGGNKRDVGIKRYKGVKDENWEVLKW